MPHNPSAMLVDRLSDEADLCRNDGAEDIANLLDESRIAIVHLTDALQEITLGRGEFNREPLIHAENTIESMKQVAKDALAQVGGAA
jgi:hypothetical protein